MRGRAVPRQSRAHHPEQTFHLIALILPHQQHPKNVREEDDLLKEALVQPALQCQGTGKNLNNIQSLGMGRFHHFFSMWQVKAAATSSCSQPGINQQQRNMVTCLHSRLSLFGAGTDTVFMKNLFCRKMDFQSKQAFLHEILFALTFPHFFSMIHFPSFLLPLSSKETSPKIIQRQC